MASHDKKRYSIGEKEESGRETMKSMVVSLLIVGLALVFVSGFRYYLKHHSYQDNTKPYTDNIMNSKETAEKDKYVEDEEFESCYLMIKNISASSPVTEQTQLGKKEEKGKSLSNGQIVKAHKKGVYHEEIYYLLEDGKYLKYDETQVEELKKYLPMTGYVIITYINSSGVRLRSWANFDDDNVVKSVYVGDRVNIIAKVTTKDNHSAYITDEGLYITTNSRYFGDNTAIQEDFSDSDNKIKEKSKEESTAQGR